LLHFGHIPHPQPLKAYCQSPYGEIPVSLIAGQWCSYNSTWNLVFIEILLIVVFYLKITINNKTGYLFIFLSYHFFFSSWLSADHWLIQFDKFSIFFLKSSSVSFIISWIRLSSNVSRASSRHNWKISDWIFCSIFLSE
jgi:hypothetical protein